MKSVLFFDAMLTPKIITLIYWILLIAGIGTGIGFIYKGDIAVGLISIPISVILSRVWCELLIVLFKIHDRLKELVETK